jgi:DNA-binding XRE family transcriptional regulator
VAIIKNNLKEILESRGIKQKWLADKADVNERTLSNCINDRHDVSLKIALQIAKVLDMRVDDIFVLSDEEATTLHS